ncbi:hypothetical protein [Mucilaginibacter myungsuensis]|uniref:Uncharacterized protein n=1 Tax=Mucilaginibacter myungsuensis TaxID=649104 RepID=A0A929PXP5_9SPHI|nr:hypothetical protein [Mucilaginibacter myungsuensis]MBE9662615.1 hypothetical protein [Mucilaginibacter myungsuensis]MDN3598035.1 hypothetical protein [Mucilaginibacter myungsuensis]
MSQPEPLPTLHYNFDISRYEDELAIWGYCDNVVGGLPDGNSYQVCFYNAMRLSMEVADKKFIAIPNMIVVSALKRAQMENAVNEAWESGFFDELKPIN